MALFCAVIMEVQLFITAWQWLLSQALPDIYSFQKRIMFCYESMLSYTEWDTASTLIYYAVCSPVEDYGSH
jgi:hypothetical protein